MAPLGAYFRPGAIAGIALLLASLASPAFAGTVLVPCVTGNLSTIDGTTCDIGSLQFTFTGLDESNFSYDQSANTFSYGTPWTDSDFTFTVLRNGFELSGPGQQSIAAPGDGEELDYAALVFDVTDLDGAILASGISGLIGPSVSGTGYSQEQNEIFLQGPLTNQIAETDLIDSSGFIYGYSNVYSGGPISSSNEGAAYPFYLVAGNGNSASISSTDTSFTFTSVPEPASILMIGTILAGLGGLLRRRI